MSDGIKAFYDNMFLDKVTTLDKLAGIQRIVETDEQKVIRLMKGGFEATIGMTFERYCEIRKDIIKNHPEKLI